MGENEIIESGEGMSDTNADYVAAIKELQNNTVSKTQYAKLREENKKLLDALVSGKQIDVPDNMPKESIRDMRKKLFNRDGNLSNIEYVENVLKLRTALMEKGERDPFLPIGDIAKESSEMYDTAERVATVLQECVDFADGDSGIFTAELQRRMKDTPIRR